MTFLLQLTITHLSFYPNANRQDLEISILLDLLELKVFIFLASIGLDQ